MSAVRKPFRREGEDLRRRALVEATLTCIATLGMEGTTVREIAIKAGVTAGLIRHYFSSKDELVLAAYSHYVDQMASQSRDAVNIARPDPLSQLAAFVRANLSEPVVDQTNLALWAGFIKTVRTNPAMGAIHLQGYNGYRGRGDGRMLIARIDQVRQQIRQLDRRNILSDREAYRLDAEAQQLRSQVRQLAYNGVDRRERFEVERRIARLEQRVTYNANDRDDRYDRGNGYGQQGQWQDRDGRWHDANEPRDRNYN